jgi:hypothetical protein
LVFGHKKRGGAEAPPLSAYLRRYSLIMVTAPQITMTIIAVSGSMLISIIHPLSCVVGIKP